MYWKNTTGKTGLPGLPTPDRMLTQDRNHQTIQAWTLMTITTTMTMMTPSIHHVPHDTPKSHMAQAALTPLSCISTLQTGPRYSPQPRDFGVSLCQWCSDFQSVVCTKMSFENALPEPLRPSKRRVPIWSLVSHLITVIQIH